MPSKKPSIVFEASKPAPNEKQPQSPDSAKDWKPDDYDIALKWIDHAQERIGFWHGEWHGLGESFWEHRSHGDIMRDISVFVAQNYRKYGITITATRIESVVKLARWQMTINDERIKAAVQGGKQYIPMLGGYSYDLTKHIVVKTPPELYFTSVVPYAFDQTATCPTFTQYLSNSLVEKRGGRWVTDDEMILLCLEMMGYCLTSRTDLQAAFWLYGLPESGKSTLLGVIKKLAGQFYTALDFNQMGNNRFILSGLIGKRVAVYGETNAGTMLPDGIFKTLVGGEDETWTDVKNKTAVSFKNEAKLIWAMNNPPQTMDRSGGVYRRLNAILFPRTFSKGDPARIDNLDSKLEQELPGIFNLVMHNYRNMGKAFSAPRRSVEYIRQYAESNDTEQTFISDWCEVGNNYSISTRDFYWFYKCFCEEFGFKPKNINRVSEDWRRLGFSQKHERNGNMWLGVRVKQQIHGKKTQ